MGYESRMVVVNKYENNYGSVIADLRLSVMPHEFVQLFKQEIDFDVYIEHDDVATKTDCYGKVLKCEKLEVVYDWLVAHEQTEYRRQMLARMTLKSFIEGGDWSDSNLLVVHYGY